MQRLWRQLFLLCTLSRVGPAGGCCRGGARTTTGCTACPSSWYSSCSGDYGRDRGEEGCGFLGAGCRRKCECSNVCSPPPPSPPPPSPPPPSPPPPSPPPPSPPPPSPPPPTSSPTQAPSTSAPTQAPTKNPTNAPSAAPTTAQPSTSPSLSPTSSPTFSPTAAPSVSPTVSPTTAPTWSPTAAPTTSSPSVSPTTSPTTAPTDDPTRAPSVSPTKNPSRSPTTHPTLMPSFHACDDGSHGCHNLSAGGICIKVGGNDWACACDKHYWCSAGCNNSHVPHECTLITRTPTTSPTASPTKDPSRNPSVSPTVSPTTAPTTAPTVSPTTSPTRNPSVSPTTSPTWSPTGSPTAAPTTAPSTSPSTSPTTAPTQNPSVSPTTAPTQSPTTDPTASPTRSPTTAPTYSPTTSPTVSPSRSPSSPPTRSPSFSPTTAPTWSPSVSPTTSPTDSPSVPPTQIPSFSPSVPPTQGPTGQPSATPSWAPSLTPSTNPTNSPSSASPTGQPSTRPSVAPRTAPSALPTAAPSPMPTRGGVGEDLEDAAAEGAAVAAVLAISAPAAAQGGRMAILSTGCTGKKPVDDLPFTLHPTQVSIPGFSLPMHAGCAILNLVIAAGAAALHALAALALQKATGKTRMAAQGMIRFPSGPVLLFAVLGQGPVFAGARLIRHASGSIDAITGFVTLMVCSLLPLTVWHEGKRSQRQAVYKLDPDARDGCKRYWLGAGEWLSLHTRDQYNFRVERWGVVFRAALPWQSGVLALDVVLSQAVALSAGAGGGSCAACGWMRIGDALASFLLTAVILKRKPYARPIRLPVTVLAQVLIGIGALILAGGFLSSGCGGGELVAGIFIAAGGAATLVVVILDGTAVLRSVQLRRRDQLTAALQRFQAMDKGGSGELTKEELYDGLVNEYGRKIAAAEFDELFRLVDADGSGEVDLHEFLGAEHHFWDAGKAGGADGGLVDAMESNNPLLQTMESDQGNPQLGEPWVASPMGRGGGSKSRRLRPSASSRSPMSRSIYKTPSSSQERRAGGGECAFVFSGCGDPDLDGPYDEVTARREQGLISPRRYKRRGGTAQVLRSADGAWRIEVPLERDLERQGRRQMSRHGSHSFSPLDPDSPRRLNSPNVVLYTHPGGDFSDPLPPREGWETTPQGTAPPPQVNVPPELEASGAWEGYAPDTPLLPNGARFGSSVKSLTKSVRIDRKASQTRMSRGSRLRQLTRGAAPAGRGAGAEEPTEMMARMVSSPAGTFTRGGSQHAARTPRRLRRAAQGSVVADGEDDRAEAMPRFVSSPASTYTRHGSEAQTPGRLRRTLPSSRSVSAWPRSDRGSFDNSFGWAAPALPPTAAGADESP
eukprot:TRINITY_DN5256_c0_g3_i1.p1 TRINITY_DN5256_c0_g3~~TRINITY_DN5256_c0_g3_i1.p1  ORF type:complete len:1344 (+),score=177.62 TRINITY_DN5256_c0_g3_i1:74-4105(+)